MPPSEKEPMAKFSHPHSGCTQQIGELKLCNLWLCRAVEKRLLPEEKRRLCAQHLVFCSTTTVCTADRKMTERASTPKRHQLFLLQVMYVHMQYIHGIFQLNCTEMLSYWWVVPREVKGYLFPLQPHTHIPKSFSFPVAFISLPPPSLLTIHPHILILNRVTT